MCGLLLATSIAMHVQGGCDLLRAAGSAKSLELTSGIVLLVVNCSFEGGWFVSHHDDIMTATQACHATGCSHPS